MIGILKKLLITYHRHEIRCLEQRQDAVLHICTKSAARLKGYERNVMIEESLLMINGLGRKISKHQHRIEQLSALRLKKIGKRFGRN